MNQLKLFFVAVGLFMAGNMMAQKSTTISSFEDTQARVVDPYARAYVKPLTCELEVKDRVSLPIIHFYLIHYHYEKDFHVDGSYCAVRWSSGSDCFLS